jgi:hypothetical protein
MIFKFGSKVEIPIPAYGASTEQFSIDLYPHEVAFLSLSPTSIKGKEKFDPDIDWTGWEAQHYDSHQLERTQARLVKMSTFSKLHEQLLKQVSFLDARYADQAREFKRLSDVQRQQISQARAALPDPRAPIPEEVEVMSDLAAVRCVDSLLLFTQSFLATKLTRSAMTWTDQCSQCSSMIGFLEGGSKINYFSVGHIAHTCNLVNF